MNWKDQVPLLTWERFLCYIGIALLVIGFVGVNGCLVWVLYLDQAMKISGKGELVFLMNFASHTGVISAIIFIVGFCMYDIVRNCRKSRGVRMGITNGKTVGKMFG